jgi:hypothetical protein
MILTEIHTKNSNTYVTHHIFGIEYDRYSAVSDSSAPACVPLTDSAMEPGSGPAPAATTVKTVRKALGRYIKFINAHPESGLSAGDFNRRPAEVVEVAKAAEVGLGSK